MTQPRRALFHAPLDSGVEQAECAIGDECENEEHYPVLVAGSAGVLRFACPNHEERDVTDEELGAPAGVSSREPLKKGDRIGNGHGIGFVIYQPLSVWPPEAPSCPTCNEPMRARGWLARG